MRPIQIIEYGVGNKKSLMNAIAALGLESVLRVKAADIDPSAPIILPGVGSFSFCKKKLVEADLFDPLLKLLHEGNPVCFVGICVGMQLLFEESVEDGVNAGFGYFEGRVSSLRQEVGLLSNNPVRFPNTHWENIVGVEQRGPYYFTHSYGNLNSRDRVAYYELGGMQVTATASRGAVTGFQFHPEKSAGQGLDLLARILNQTY
ncbi:UNVERIFIED_ORG: glutamine amidotransferase [Shinella zoogloeoides]|nr:glutamine amidotransferase [Shinella zoogloeoides]